MQELPVLRRHHWAEKQEMCRGQRELLYRCRTSKSIWIKWPWGKRIGSTTPIWSNSLLIRNRVVNSSIKVTIKWAAWCTRQYPNSLGRKSKHPKATKIFNQVCSKWQEYRRRTHRPLSQVVRWRLTGFSTILQNHLCRSTHQSKSRISFSRGTNRWSPSPGQQT